MFRDKVMKKLLMLLAVMMVGGVVDCGYLPGDIGGVDYTGIDISSASIISAQTLKSGNILFREGDNYVVNLSSMIYFEDKNGHTIGQCTSDWGFSGSSSSTIKMLVSLCIKYMRESQDRDTYLFKQTDYLLGIVEEQNKLLDKYRKSAVKED